MREHLEPGLRKGFAQPLAGNDSRDVRRRNQQQDGNLVISAIKQPETGSALIVRLRNPGDQKGKRADGNFPVGALL